VRQDFPAGTKIAKKCLKMANELEDSNKMALLKARIYCVLSAISRNAKQFEKALTCVEKALQVEYNMHGDYTCNVLTPSYLAWGLIFRG
jgi:lipopolysaccharide biosynthesis regulator YciM